MIDYLDIRAICHSSFSEEEKARRKAELKPLNHDFLMDLPSQVRDIMEQLCWSYKDQPWFEEAWEKYREHVLDAGLGGKIKMPGFVFNEYIDRYVDEQEKRRNKELAHMDACDIDELYHHGVKGQRWGIRRYQNDDGTLTAEGRKRYGVDNLADMSKEQRKLYEQDRRESLKSAKADIKRQGLKTNYIGGTKNLERLNRGADMIRSKYGQLTLDDFAADESKKATRVAIGTSVVAMLASVGGMALMIKAAS